MCAFELDSYGSVYGPMAGSCEHGKERSGYTKIGDFLTGFLRTLLISACYMRRTCHVP
jgi:hypothetical protein